MVFVLNRMPSEYSCQTGNTSTRVWSDEYWCTLILYIYHWQILQWKDRYHFDEIFEDIWKIPSVISLQAVSVLKYSYMSYYNSWQFVLCWKRKSIAIHYIQLFRKGPVCVVILQVSSQWAIMYHPWNISWYHKKNYHFKRSWTFDHLLTLLVMKPKFSVRIRSISWPIPYMSCRRQYPGPRFNIQ